VKRLRSKRKSDRIAHRLDTQKGHFRIHLVDGIRDGWNAVHGISVRAHDKTVFCLSLWYTKSLWWAVGFHAGWDWSQSFFYGTSDSGLLVKGHLFASHASGSSALERRNDRSGR
jgi:hypothetical protein